MNEHPLADLGWKVNSLLVDGAVRALFRDRCHAYLALHEDTSRPPPLPFDTKGDYGRVTDKPPLLPCERYARREARRVDRLDWLASNLKRPGYCDEAAEDAGGPPGEILAFVAWGIDRELREVFDLVRSKLEEIAEEEDADDE
jgi:hypothetical protein